MQRLGHHVSYQALLDDAPGIHHCQAVGNLYRSADVVRDKDHRHAQFTLQFAQQQQNLNLHRGVKRRGGFIGQQQLGSATQGQRDHCALTHTARKLVGIGIQAAPGLRFTALAVPGNAPPYSSHRREQVTGDNIALRITDTAGGATLFYSPGLARVDEQEQGWLDGADCVLMDGTFWREDEMQHASLGSKTASGRGHLSQQGFAGRPGMVDVLRESTARRKVLIHIDNSNPILDEDSAPRRTLDSLGIEVAHDGMEISL